MTKSHPASYFSLSQSLCWTNYLYWYRTSLLEIYCLVQFFPPYTIVQLLESVFQAIHFRRWKLDYFKTNIDLCQTLIAQCCFSPPVNKFWFFSSKIEFFMFWDYFRKLHSISGWVPTFFSHFCLVLGVFEAFKLIFQKKIHFKKK